MEQFEYTSDRFGYVERLARWTEEVNREYRRTTAHARARAGFVPEWRNNQPRLQCSFCAVTIIEPTSDSDIIIDHVNSSPDCILMQSEINYEPRRPEYFSVEARRRSFIDSERFGRIRPGFQHQHLERIMNLLVETGFYFATQVNVFDQIKCFFCDATFSCDIFGQTDLNEGLVRRIHAHQNNKCSFLISLLGPIAFLRHLREGPYRVVPRVPQTQQEPNHGSVDDMDGVTLVEETDLTEDIARETFNELFDKMACQVCRANRAVILFLPCRHVGVCPTCYSQIEVCLICQTRIERKVGVRYG